MSLLAVHRRLGVGFATALVATLLATLVGVVPQAQAAVGQPGGLSPAGGTALASNFPTLSWNRVAGATRYEVWADDDPGFGSPVKATTVNRRWVAREALATGANYWRVRAFGSDNLPGPWAEAHFTIKAASGPALTQITPNPLPQPDNPPLLEWAAVPRATGYEVEVSTEPEFLAPVKATTTTTSYVVPQTAASEDYDWRVRALFGPGIASNWSNPYGTYSIDDLDIVTYQSPAQGEAVEDVALDWQPIRGAVYYELRVGTDPDLNTFQQEVTKIRGTRYSPDATYNNNDGWYWKVRAVNASGEKVPWASVPLRTFQRQWLDSPALVHPENTINPAVGDDFYFEWTPVQHATHYELWVGTDSNFSPNTYKICTTAATTYTAGHYQNPLDACMPMGQGTVYHWKVRAIDAPANVQGIFSPVRQFIYNSGPVVMVSPADGATVAVPTLTWQPQQNVETYHVRIEGSGSYQISTKTYATSWTPPLLDATKGPFTWTVWAQDVNGSQSPIYPERSFTLEGTPPDTAAAPLTPLTGTGTTHRFPSLSWEPAEGAVTYRIRVGVSGSSFWFQSTMTPFLNTAFRFPAATDVGKDILATSPGSYDWQVRAFDSAGDPIGSWGSTGTFTIADLETVTGHSIALTGSSLDADVECAKSLADAQPAICTNVPTTPVLDWDPVPDASFYMIYLAEERELTNLVYTSVPVTTNTRWTPTLLNSPRALADNDANKAYYWVIRPCKAISICASDPISTEAVANHAFSKVSPPVELVGPANDVVETDGEIVFHWRDYLDTNLDTTYAATGEASTQTAKQYRIEVSETDTFGTLVDLAIVDQTTYTAWNKTYPEGRLYWRVQAIDAHGNLLARSPVRTFVKSSPAPTLTSPVGNVLTNGLEAFRWEPSRHASRYTLEVYKNNDTTFSSANRVFTCTTPQTACTNTAPFAASGASYVWRVRWSDGDNRLGPWSTVGRFRSGGQAPTLNLPLSGALVPATDSYFTWSAAPGATPTTYFRFERRLQGAAHSAEVVITGATAHAPQVALTDGAWEWRVTALDANKQDLASSAWRSFNVDGTQPVLTAWSPTDSARPKANFKLTFSEPVTNVTKRTFFVKPKGVKTKLRGRLTVSSDRLRATFNPKPLLKRGKVYIVTVKPTIHDLGGNSLARKRWKVRIK